MCFFYKVMKQYDYTMGFIKVYQEYQAYKGLSEKIL